MPQKQGLQTRGAEPKPTVMQVEHLWSTRTWNLMLETDALVLSSPETFGYPKPALRLLPKLQITAVFAEVFIKLITTGLSELILLHHRTRCTMNFRGDTGIKRLILFLLIFFPIHKNKLIPLQQFQAT